MQGTGNLGTDGPDLHHLVARAVQDERARLSRELHDELLQALFVLRLECQWVEDHLDGDRDGTLEKVRSMRATLDTMAGSVRQIVSGLRPAPLAHGFSEAIRSLARQFTASSGVPCGLDIDDGVDAPEPRASVAYRVVQEALHNVRKHAGAHSVNVRVEKQGAGLRVAVQDDGAGFDPAVPRRGASMGLDGMHERVRSLRGDLIVVSTPSRGTTVEARLPADATALPSSASRSAAGQAPQRGQARDLGIPG